MSDPHEELPIVVVKLINGNLIVPKAANMHGVRGDGMAEIGPDDPSYESWMNSIERSGHYIEQTKHL